MMDPQEPPFAVGDVIDVAVPHDTLSYGDTVLGMWPGGRLLVWCRGVQPGTVAKMRIAGVSYHYEEVMGVAHGEVKPVPV